MRRVSIALATVVIAATLAACDGDMTPEKCHKHGGTIQTVPGPPVYVQVGKVMVPMPQTRDACILPNGSEVTE